MIRYYLLIVFGLFILQQNIVSKNLSYNSTLSDKCVYTVFGEIRCGTSGDLDEVDIEFIFNGLENEIVPDQRNFTNLFWSLSIKDGILPANVFRDFQFEQVYWYTSLEKIDVNAFTSSRTGFSWFHYPNDDSNLVLDNKLINYPNTQYDIYEAFSQIKDPIRLQLDLDKDYLEHEIPNNAFRNAKWDKIEEIFFFGNFSILRVGDNIIRSLPSSINSFGFDMYPYKGSSIKKISKDAFQIEPCNNCSVLTIAIHNLILTEDSLEEGVFDITGRIIALRLAENELTTLSQKIFEPLLNNNEENTLEILFNPIDCSPQSIYQLNWILKKNQYINRVHITCADGRDIWDIFKCNSKGEYDGQYGVKKWPLVYPGQYSIANCTNGSDGKIRWFCKDNLQFNEDGPFFDECWLNDLVDKEIDTIEVAIDVLDILKESLNSDTSLNFISSLYKVKTIINNLNHFLQTNTIGSDISEDITQSFVYVYSQTIDQTNAWNNGTDSERQGIASEVLFLIQKTSFAANCYLNSENNTKEFVSNNLYQKLFYNFTESLYFEYNSSSVSVPQRSGFEDIDEMDNSCRDESSLGALIRKLNNYLTQSLHKNRQINSEIIAFNIRNTNQTNELKDGSNVKISLKHRERLHLGDRIECMFWDFSSQKWSSEGCRLVIEESNRDTTVCECNHLTNFAAIMDLSGREEQDFTKQVITQICCSLSVISLVLTILLIARKKWIFKILKLIRIDLRRSMKNRNQITGQGLKTRDQIVLNQSICLLIANLIILFGMDRDVIKIDGLCYAMSVLLLYSLLSAFVWMVLHGIHLFRMTYYPLKKQNKIQIYLSIGYTIPFLICILGFVGIWLHLGLFKEALVGSDYFCWISSPKHPQNVWILIGPVIITIVVNISSIAFLIHLAAKVQWKTQIKDIFVVLLLAVNLGLSWALFVSYMQRVSASPQIFSYFFIILNASQGIFILIYQIWNFSRFHYRLNING